MLDETQTDQLEADGIGVDCVQVTAELVLAVIAERLIPSACGVIIVSSGVADTVRSRELMWQEAAFSCVFKGKLQHFHARKCEAVTECFYFGCDHTEILCDDRKILPSAFWIAENNFPSGRFLPLTVYCSRLTIWDGPVCFKSPEMIDPENVQDL